MIGRYHVTMIDLNERIAQKLEDNRHLNEDSAMKIMLIDWAVE